VGGCNHSNEQSFSMKFWYFPTNVFIRSDPIWSIELAAEMLFIEMWVMAKATKCSVAKFVFDFQHNASQATVRAP